MRKTGRGGPVEGKCLTSCQIAQITTLRKARIHITSFTVEPMQYNVSQVSYNTYLYIAQMQICL